MTIKDTNPVLTKSTNDESNFANYASIFASALQILSIFIPFVVQGLNMASNQAIIFTASFAVVFALIGLLIMWISHGRPSASIPYIIFYVAIFIAILLSTMLIYTKVNSVTTESKSTLNSLQIQDYSISILAYKDNNGDSSMNGLDDPISNISIIIHDAYSDSHIGATNREGRANITLPRTGIVQVEVCGQSQTHYIDDKHVLKNPYYVSVAIKNPEKCRKNN